MLTPHLPQQVAGATADVKHPLVALPDKPFQRPLSKIDRIDRVELVGAAAHIEMPIVGVFLFSKDLRILSELFSHHRLPG
jgi:hypothetical protein